MFVVFSFCLCTYIALFVSSTKSSLNIRTVWFPVYKLECFTYHWHIMKGVSLFYWHIKSFYHFFYLKGKKSITKIALHKNFDVTYHPVYAFLQINHIRARHTSVIICMTLARTVTIIILVTKETTERLCSYIYISDWTLWKSGVLISRRHVKAFLFWRQWAGLWKLTWTTCISILTAFWIYI
jgi:hypothetical protein